MLDWDDLRFVLAVARGGSALSAARKLGVNQTTVTRRLAHIEVTMGVNLFDRHQKGYRLTDLGARVAQVAEAIETQVLTLETEVAALDRAVAGVVRFTCPETIANHVLAPWLGDFRRQYPDVLVEVINADAMLDLQKGEADVAIRMGGAPFGSGVVARRLPDCLWTAYSSGAYARENGLPQRPEDLPIHATVGLDGALGRLQSAVWFREIVGADRIKVRCSSLSNVVHSLRAGLGVGMLPCVIGDTEPELLRCFEPIPALNAQTWMIVREEVKSAPHVRAFADFVSARLPDVLRGGSRASAS
jgi:DNA-binding transcriptional LysR family regulator